MNELIDLEAKAHSSRVLGEFLSSQPAGAFERAGLKVSNATAISSDLASMRQLFQPIASASGHPVTDYTAMLVSTVFACLSKIGGAVLQLPLHQYRMTGNGSREAVQPKSRLWWMLNERPSATWTAASWKEWIVRCVHLRGDQHTEIMRKPGEKNGGEIIGLYPHHPDCVVTRRYVNEFGEIRLAYDVQNPLTKTSYTLDQDDMLHFSGFGFDGLQSISVVQHAARAAIGNSLAASDFSGKSLGTGAMPKIALTYPAKMSPDQADLLRKSFVATYGAGSQQTQFPLILTEGGTAMPLNISPVDMELLGSRRLEAQQICEAFGVPPIMIGDSEKTSSWGTGVEQIVLGFVKFTLQPHLCRWEEELNAKLFRNAGQYVEFELDALLRGDSKAQAESFRYALGGPGSGDGYMSVNEIRKLKNLPDLGAEHDAPFKAVVPPAGPSPAATEEAAAQANMMRAIAAMAAREPAPSVFNLTAPTVNIAPAAIEVRAGDTHVTLPEGCVRVDNTVNTPAVHVGGVNVDVKPHPGGMQQTVTRDAAGDIEQIVTGATRQIITRDAQGDIAAVTTTATT